LKLKKYSFLKR